MGLPCLDVVLGLAARGIKLLVKMLAAAALEIGDDVAGIPPHGAKLDAGNHAARFRPRPGRVGESLEPAQLLPRRAGVARSRRRLQSRDVLRQTVNGGVKFGHWGGAKAGQFGASALERAALI